MSDEIVLKDDLTKYVERAGLHPMGVGQQMVLKFPNGYGASIIKTPYSYGGSSGKFELAVLQDGKLCYDTPITNDVIGWLSSDEVINTLYLIMAL